MWVCTSSSNSSINVIHKNVKSYIILFERGIYVSERYVEIKLLKLVWLDMLFF